MSLPARKNDPANMGVPRPEPRPERRGLGFSVAAEQAAANRSVRDWRHLRPLAAPVFLRLTDTARLGETRRWGRILAKSLQISLPARYLLPLLSKIAFQELASVHKSLRLCDLCKKLAFDT